MGSEREAAGAVDIILDGRASEPMARIEADDRTKRGRVAKFVAIPGGMSNGAASVAIVGQLRNGGTVLLRTSMRLLYAAVDAFRARYGIEADGASPAELSAAAREKIQAAIMVKLIRDREGAEVTIDVAELNAIMGAVAGPTGAEIVYAPDGRSLTIRVTRSE